MKINSVNDLGEDEEPVPFNYQQISSIKENNVGNKQMLITEKNGQLQTYKAKYSQKTEEITNESKISYDKRMYTEQISNRKDDFDIYNEPEAKLLNLESLLVKHNKPPTKNLVNKSNSIVNKNYNKEEEVEEIQRYPNPSITGKNNYNIYSNNSGINLNSSLNNISQRNNYFQDYVNKDFKKLKSEKSVGVVSDISIKPRKGDRTPKSNNSNNDDFNQIETIEHEKSNQEEKFINKIATHEEDIPRIDDEFKHGLNEEFTKQQKLPKVHELSSLSPTKNQNKTTLNTNPNKTQTINDKNKTQTSMLSTDKNFAHYDIQQLSYDLIKEYSYLRIDKDESFMQRMLFDIFKRQSKEERMEKLLERNKVKIDENERIKTFNHLIEDANRRLEAQEHMENMKLKLEESELPAHANKKYKLDEWQDIYEERFIKFKNEKEKWIEDRVRDKLTLEKEKEDQIIESNKSRKVPSHVVDKIVKRMYEEAERRKIREQQRIKNVDEDECQFESNEEFESPEKDSNMALNKFKKFKNTQKYNFQSDMSGHEKTDSEEERDIPMPLNSNKSKMKTNSKQKINKLNNKKNSKNVNPQEISNRLYNQSKKTTKEEIQPLKKINYKSNTEFNNKRFEQDRLQYVPEEIINEDDLVNFPKKSSKGNRNKDRNQKNKAKPNKIDKRVENIEKELLKYELDEEVEIRNAPKPIEVSLLSNKIMNVKLNDLKKVKVSQINNQNEGNNHLYMPDFVASKLVDDILQRKFDQ